MWVSFSVFCHACQLFRPSYGVVDQLACEGRVPTEALLTLQTGLETRSVEGIIANTTLQNGQLQVPCSNTQEVVKSRIKSKDIYEGTFKVTAACISWSEVTGLIVDLQQLCNMQAGILL